MSCVLRLVSSASTSIRRLRRIRLPGVTAALAEELAEELAEAIPSIAAISFDSSPSRLSLPNCVSGIDCVSVKVSSVFEFSSVKIYTSEMELIHTEKVEQTRTTTYQIRMRETHSFIFLLFQKVHSIEPFPCDFHILSRALSRFFLLRSSKMASVLVTQIAPFQLNSRHSE